MWHHFSIGTVRRADIVVAAVGRAEMVKKVRKTARKVKKAAKKAVT